MGCQALSWLVRLDATSSAALLRSACSAVYAVRNFAVWRMHVSRATRTGGSTQAQFSCGLGFSGPALPSVMGGGLSGVGHGQAGECFTL